jgi:hypothetical protein
VRDHLKDATAFANTIDRLKGFGYCVVELIHSETVSDQEVAKICGAAGVAVAAAHIPGEVIIKRPESVVEKTKNGRCQDRRVRLSARGRFRVEIGGRAVGRWVGAERRIFEARGTDIGLSQSCDGVCSRW